MRKVLKRLAVFLLLAVVIGAVAAGPTVYRGYALYREAVRETPVSVKAEEIQSRADYVRLEDISDSLIEKVIESEDQRFYFHFGVDPLAILRAAKNDLLAGSFVEGGSTITQQLAKNMYYTYQPSYLRKVSEIFTAYDLERELSKKEILELYVNVINYGDNYIGIKAASEGYFHKEPKDLTLDEATLLAGLPQSPANYQLSNHESAARNRQIQVLNAMIRENMIDEQQKAAVMKQVEK